MANPEFFQVNGLRRAAQLALPLLFSVLLPLTASAADPWRQLHSSVQHWRTGELADLPGELTELTRSKDSEVQTLARFLQARYLTQQGDGKGSLDILKQIKSLRNDAPASFDWAEITALQAAGDWPAAFEKLAEFRKEYKDFRWAAADLLYVRLSQKVAPPDQTAALALQLYDKSKLHLPQDELLSIAARATALFAPDKAKVLWRKLLMKHPESDWIPEAQQGILPSELTDQEQFERVERLFARRAYERCRELALQLWHRGVRKSEVGYYLGKIGSERLRDDYPSSIEYLREASVDKEPLATQALTSYALVLGKMGRYDESIGQFDAWLAKYPDVPIEKLVEVHYDRARMLRMAGKPLDASQAMAQFLEAHKTGFDFGKYQWFVGFWAYLGGECDRAIAAFKPLIANVNPLVGGKARYWTGRCQEKLQQKGEAIKTLTSLQHAMPLTWYGALAADVLTQWGEGKHVLQPPDFSKIASEDPSPFAGLPRSPELKKLKIAMYLGEPDMAQRVWTEFEPALRKQLGKVKLDQLQTALADPLEQYAQARESAYAKYHKDVQGMPTIDTLDKWRAVYPRAFATHARAASRAFAVPEWMIYAHMLQESRYKPWLISGAPAYGLLELLDRTAARLAAEHKEDYQLWMLMQPAHNVHWGAQYLGALYHKFGEQLPFAIASYNGGPMLLQYHLQVASQQKLRLDEMVDDLGPHESRNYIRMVVGHFLRYLALYESPSTAAILRKQLLPWAYQAQWHKDPDY